MSAAPLCSIAAVRDNARTAPAPARVHGQVDELIKKDSSNGKPYWEMRLRDHSDSLTLRAWNDSDAYHDCNGLRRGDCIEIAGDFAMNGSFGLDARRWRARVLDDAECLDLFRGSAMDSQCAERDFEAVCALASSLLDPRLRGLAGLFIEEFGIRFRRAAAARHNHHAHRGGLLRHTAQMMRSADVLCGIHPVLNRDLLLAGALFHDSGKLWEMCPPERGFEIPRDLRGELLGHIPIGIELVNALWRRLPLDDWKVIQPSNEDVRLHLLHLVASHHGELQFGSPVEPKTPEAVALNMIDNLDARLEMFAMAYARHPEIAPGIHERIKALNSTPVKPLSSFVEPA